MHVAARQRQSLARQGSAEQRRGEARRGSATAKRSKAMFSKGKSLRLTAGITPDMSNKHKGEAMHPNEPKLNELEATLKVMLKTNPLTPEMAKRIGALESQIARRKREAGKA